MNIQGIETVLFGMVVSALLLTFFICLGALVLNFFKSPEPSRFRQGNEKTVNSKNLRKKIETKPTIICSLPIHQTGRSEAPLS